MKDWWLKFGCFVSGYNYITLSNCSEVSKKFVKKITSALLIVCIIWAFIGYLFSTRYFQIPWYGAVLGSLVMLIIIIQIERQIILAVKNSLALGALRLLLGVIIAIIGSTIIDQVFFENDINIKRKDLISERTAVRKENAVNAREATIAELRKQIFQADSQIMILTKSIEREGTVVLSGTTSRTTRNQRDSSITRSTETNRMANPKIQERQNYFDIKTAASNKVVDAERAFQEQVTAIENDALKEKVGFLDELGIMFKLLQDSNIALIVYILWFLFFFFIELFILFTKWGEEPNDYDKVIRYQMEIREKRLFALEDKYNNYMGEDENVGKSQSLVQRFPG